MASTRTVERPLSASTACDLLTSMLDLCTSQVWQQQANMASAVLRSAAIAFGKRQAQRHVARCFSTTSMPKAALTLDDLSVDAHNMDVNAAAALYKEHGCVVVRGLNLPYVERVQSGTKSRHAL